jgi:hypothetical protein
MSNLEEKQEIVAKNALHYIASLLEQNKVSIKISLGLMQFLGSGVEGAENEDELRKLKADVKAIYPSLPEFEPGI